MSGEGWGRSYSPVHGGRLPWEDMSICTLVSELALPSVRERGSASGMESMDACI